MKPNLLENINLGEYCNANVWRGSFTIMGVPSVLTMEDDFKSNFGCGIFYAI